MGPRKPFPNTKMFVGRYSTGLGRIARRFLIAIDGADGIGKSSFASWLAWQTGMPSVHLDLYTTDLRQWRTDELRRVINKRLDLGMPVIVEGVLALDALDQGGLKANFLIYVQGEGSGGRTITERLVEYRSRQKPEQKAHCSLAGYVEIP